MDVGTVVEDWDKLVRYRPEQHVERLSMAI